MKVAELLDLARDCERRPPGSTGQRIGLAVIDLLGESGPCGFDEPEIAPAIAKPTMIRVPATWADWVSVEDARAMARMLWRASDEAEGK